MQDTRLHTDQRKPGEVETRFEVFVAPQNVGLNIVKTTMWQAFLWSSSV